MDVIATPTLAGMFLHCVGITRDVILARQPEPIEFRIVISDSSRAEIQPLIDSQNPGPFYVRSWRDGSLLITGEQRASTGIAVFNLLLDESRTKAKFQVSTYYDGTGHQSPEAEGMASCTRIDRSEDTE